MIYRGLVRPALFLHTGGDAEEAHQWTLDRLVTLSRRPWALAGLTRVLGTRTPVEVFGLRFANSVGLAAGMDKDGVALAAWPALGFGFVEIGTVTRHAQPGNDRPRLFRLRRSEAVINRMGFNNAGAEALAHRLAAQSRPGIARSGGASSEVGSAGVLPVGVPLGISIGKSKITPLAEAVGDYVASLRLLHPYADYVAVNVSSPNTPGLRALQDRAHLDELLHALTAAAAGLGRADVGGGSGGSASLAGSRGGSACLAGSAGSRGGSAGGSVTPLLVKIAPDLTDSAIAEVLDVCVSRGVAGVIATNTTVSRGGLAPADLVRGEQAGGLSGRPLAARTRQVVAFIHRETGGRLPIVGVGGIGTPADAVALVDAGASLVQIYTGLIYQGPTLVRRAARAIAAR